MTILKKLFLEIKQKTKIRRNQGLWFGENPISDKKNYKSQETGKQCMIKRNSFPIQLRINI